MGWFGRLGDRKEDPNLPTFNRYKPAWMDSRIFLVVLFQVPVCLTVALLCLSLMVQGNDAPLTLYAFDFFVLSFALGIAMLKNRWWAFALEATAIFIVGVASAVALATRPVDVNLLTGIQCLFLGSSWLGTVVVLVKTAVLSWTHRENSMPAIPPAESPSFEWQSRALIDRQEKAEAEFYQQMRLRDRQNKLD